MKEPTASQKPVKFLSNPVKMTLDKYLIWQSEEHSCDAGTVMDYLNLLKNHTSPAKVYKDRPSTRVFAINGILIKEFRFHGFRDILHHRLTTPRILINLRAAQYIAGLGIKTPEIFLVCREKWHGQTFCSDCIFAEELPQKTEFGDQSLRPWQEIARSALQTLAELHRHGVEHGDANLRNMYFTDHSAFPMGVLDLDDCRITPQPPALARRIKEAARIASSLYWTRIKSRNETVSLTETAEFCRTVYAGFSGVELPQAPFNRRINNFFTHHDYYKGIEKLAEGGLLK